MLPFYEIRVISPLMNVFGILHDLEQRTTTDAMAERARRLRLWVANTTALIRHGPNSSEVKINDLQTMHEILMGGTLRDDRNSYRL